MEAPAPCPFRYVWKGRTFCAIAIRERRYTTTEVVPSACAQCQARKILEEVGCAHLNLGVEVDEYGGSHDINIFYVSCEKLVERITVFERCGEGRCPFWAPLDGDKIEGLREEALAAQREKEANQPD